jgi:tetratricopeptide (TPR) repeat protein
MFGSKSLGFLFEIRVVQMRWSFAMQGGAVGTGYTQTDVSWPRGFVFLLFALLVAGCAGKGTEVPKQAINPLQGTNKLFLSLAERMEELATNDVELARALKSKAASLDTLGQSQAALVAIDRALAMTPEVEQQELLSTKASILFSLDRAPDALAILVPMLKLEHPVAPKQTSAVEDDPSHEYIVAAFCYMRLERWPDAVRALSRIQPSGPEDDLAAYAALTYAYVKARAAGQVADEWLDAQTEFSAAKHTGHYGALIRMWQGHFNSDELTTGLKALKGTAQQDALGEALFHRMAYVKYVGKDPSAATVLFEHLNDLAPYGNIEWIYAKQVLAAVR